MCILQYNRFVLYANVIEYLCSNLLFQLLWAFVIRKDRHTIYVCLDVWHHLEDVIEFYLTASTIIQ